MRFRREMHDVCDGVLFHDAQRRRFVAQIHFFKNVFWVLGNFFQVCQMPGIRQAIEIDEPGHARIINDVMNQVRADETSAAGDQ